MKGDECYTGRNDHLKRLPREHYLGQAYVHRTMTIEARYRVAHSDLVL